MLTLLATAAVVGLGMIFLWIASTILRDASIVDPFWGAGFVIVAWTAALLHPPLMLRTTLLVVLVSVWGLRLSLFLFWRNWGKGEDRRYQAMRKTHGDRFWWISLFTVFGLQGMILWFVSLPLQSVPMIGSNQALSWLDWIGVFVWLLGLVFEVVGDWQLARFIADPANKGRVMDRGLWRYTRHPNYFGDFCVWWGFYLIAAGGGAWWTIGSPVLMSILLLRVSGGPLLERTIIDRRPDYAAYQTRTNAFFPGPRKSG